jgi:drug/metabolite transporter (DMT)-like permease
MMRRRVWRGQLYALVAMAIWSTNYVIGRLLRSELTPATISSFRAIVSGVPLAVWVLLAYRGRPRTAPPRDGPPAPHGGGAARPGLLPVLGPLLALGFVGIFASQYLTYLALHWSLATNAIILNSASPLVTAGMAVAAGMAPFSRGLWAGLAISVLGGALVTAAGASGGARLQIDPGALLIIASMFTWGLYNLGVQRLSARLPPLAITAWAMLAGLPFLLMALAVERPPHLLATVRTYLPVLCYLAIGPSAVAYVCWNAAVRDIGAEYAMLTNNVLPIFGMLLGGLVLHEQVTVVQLLASALIIAGIVVGFRSLTIMTPAVEPGATVPDAGPAAVRVDAGLVGSPVHDERST